MKIGIKAQASLLLSGTLVVIALTTGLNWLLVRSINSEMANVTQGESLQIAALGRMELTFETAHDELLLAALDAGRPTAELRLPLAERQERLDRARIDFLEVWQIFNENDADEDEAVTARELSRRAGDIDEMARVGLQQIASGSEPIAIIESVQAEIVAVRSVIAGAIAEEIAEVRENQERAEAYEGTALWMNLGVLVGAALVVLLAGLFRQLATTLESKTKELEIARHDAEAAARAKGEFLAVMSHEIRTPMSGILGMAELLQTTALTPRQREFVEVIDRSGDALLVLINDILDFSKADAGELQLEAVELEPGELVDDAVELFAERSRGRGLALNADLRGVRGLTVMGDPGRLRQILLNLIGNALKFTEEGAITVRVRDCGSDPEIATLRFEVHDTGIGIPAEVQERLFTPFSQADSSVTRKYGGTGLGLAIARQLVERMGGEIHMESEPGFGSSFWFTVALPVTLQNLAPHASPPRPLLTGRRALILADDESNRENLCEQLALWGMEWRTATDCEAALEELRAGAARGTSYDIVLLDLDDAETGASALDRGIRGSGSLMDLRVLALYPPGAGVEEGERFLDAPWMRALEKPVRSSRILESLVELLAIEVPAKLATSHSPRARRAFASRILVAEDNDVVRQVALASLDALGCRHVDVAHDGLEAVRASEETHYDLILMDAEMPIMDGLEATRSIRAREQAARADGPAPHIPIIAMTAHVLEGERERCFDAGMDDFLSKPFTVPQLEETLLRCIREANGADVETLTAEPPVTPDTALARKAPIIEPGPLDAIRALEAPGRVGLLGSVITSYLGIAPGQLETIREAASEEDMESLRRAAYALKSASASLGALRVATLCAALEACAREGTTKDEAGALIEALEEAYRLTRAALSEDRSGGAT